MTSGGGDALAPRRGTQQIVTVSRKEPIMGRRTFTSQLYRAARLSNNLSAAASGNPRRIARRARNVTVGRAGLWRRLWR
jgi:hypothetical protein